MGSTIILKLPLSDRVIPIGTVLTGPSFIDIVVVIPYAACFDYIVTAAKTVLYQVLEDPAAHQFSLIKKPFGETKAKEAVEKNVL